MHDFNFYKLKVSKVRWIGGFGDIAWLNEKHWGDEKPKWIKNYTYLINGLAGIKRYIIVEQIFV